MLLATICVLSATCASVHAQPAGGVDQSMSPDFGIGGVGGAYFFASPGELVVDVHKQDRHRSSNTTELRAILVGPDRKVLAEEYIDDDGLPKDSDPGEPQTVRLSTTVERPGVYALNITVTQDRYGNEIIWGFRTNCQKYLIETSRGHKDERHQEPLLLLTRGTPADACFMPRQGEFVMDLSSLTIADPVTVHAADGTLIASLDVGADGKATHTFPAGTDRDATPWRLHIPGGQATVNIDGVTRWEDGDRFPDWPLWTPNIDSWFPFAEHRWLLTPYSRTVYDEPGKSGTMPFRVHNSSDREQTIGLALEFPGAKWPAKLSSKQVTLSPSKAAEVAVRFKVSKTYETRVCHIRATPADGSGFTTYSTLTVKPGLAPAFQPIEMPIAFTPYRHENEQFGYWPEYPLDNQLYFDAENHPLIRSRPGVKSIAKGQWRESAFSTAITSRPPELEGVGFGMSSTKLAFDADNDLYLVTYSGDHSILLRSGDGGQTFAATIIPPGRAPSHHFDIEQFTGCNFPENPPALVRYTRTASDPKLKWRRVNDLELFLPEKVDGEIVVGDPILISDKCIGLSSHSGIPATVVSRGSKVHVAWGEATDPDIKVPGVPAFVATYDRETGSLTEPALIGYGAPANDIHNSPSITMDSKGYLHVLAGTHGKPFQYAQSLKPNDASGGWTEAVPVGDKLPVTYIGLVCDPDDTLHLVCRLWQFGGEPFPLSSHATLGYLRKPAGKPWEEPRKLVRAAFSEYSIFYHRLTIDRVGRLFLSYDYWSTFWFYRNDHVGNRRALMMSEDGGDNWRLTRAEDLH